MNKHCPKCNKDKPLSGFYKDKRRPDGVDAICKKCHNEIVARWQRNNPEKVKEKEKRYFKNNPGKAREKSRKRRAKWLDKDREKQYNHYKNWVKCNTERSLEIKRNYNRRLRATVKGKLNSVISRSINQSLRQGVKAGRHWEDLVGFTINQLKFHLEKLFKPGMSWENYGTVWEIDHKIPIAAFNFNNPENIEFRLCWSLKNLQPLETSKNRSKGAKIEEKYLSEVIT